jgi:hypothetical protein
MTSLRQIAANRRNALKSTGPVTPGGKQQSRNNALRHGLTAETVIATLEDAADYQAFEAAVTSDYDAETAVKRELVLRLASVLWRLRRASGIETALFELMTTSPRKSRHRSPDAPPGAASSLAKANRQFLAVVENTDATRADGPHADPKADIASYFLRLAAMPTYPLDRLSRYEHMLWRQARQIVFTLESSRRRARQLSRLSFPFSSRRSERDKFIE